MVTGGTTVAGLTSTGELTGSARTVVAEEVTGEMGGAGR